MGANLMVATLSILSNVAPSSLNNAVFAEGATHPSSVIRFGRGSLFEDLHGVLVAGNRLQERLDRAACGGMIANLQLSVIKRLTGGPRFRVEIHCNLTKAQGFVQITA